MHTVIESIATGNPPAGRPQQEAAAFMQRVESSPAALRNRLPLIYEASAIDYRYSCLADYLEDDPDDFTFFPNDWSLRPEPSTEARNEHYRRAVIPLAERVACDALDQAGRAPDEVTHVIAVSCTGFFAPGLDIELVKRLGLPPTTERTFIGFMGCYAAFNALRVAHSFCQSNPEARVLILCAELCTLHFQVSQSMESAVINALFSDGAAAAVLSSQSDTDAQGQWTYIDSRTQLDDDSMEDMTWAIGDTGFIMGLSSRVPSVIAKHLPGYVDNLLAPHGLTPDALDFWAIHPGGRSIVEGARDALGLASTEVHDSLEVLRQYGNMSSPTILFVLKRIMDRQRAASNGQGTNGQHTNGHYATRHGIAMAFGPGLTLEGALFKQVT